MSDNRTDGNQRTEASGRRRASRWKSAGLGIAYGCVFAVSVVGSVVLHLPLPVTRRIVVGVINDQASKAIAGHIELGEVSRLGLDRLEVKNVRVRDPEGQTVIFAPEVQAEADLLAIGRSFLPWSDGPRIAVRFVRARRIDIVMRAAADGQPTIATTFLPTSRDTAAASSARPMVVDLRHIEVSDAHVTGHLSGLSSINWQARSLRARVLVESDEVYVDANPFTLNLVDLMPQPIGVVADFHYRSSSSLMWSDLVARYGDLAVAGRVQLKDTELLADVDLPITNQAQLAGLLPDAVRLAEPLQGKLRVNGPFNQLATTLRFQSGDAVVDATGTATLTPSIGGDWELRVGHLDLSRFLVDAPETDIDAKLVTRMRVGTHAGVRVRVEGGITPRSVYGVPIPDLRLEALADAKGVTGVVHADEPGMPIRADVLMADTGRVRVTATANAPALEKVPRLQGTLAGFAVASVEGTWDKGRLAADVAVQAGNLSAGGAKLGSADLQVKLSGPPDALQVQGSLVGARVGVSALHWPSLRATVMGPLKGPRVQVSLVDNKDRTLTLQTAMSLKQDRVVARDLRLELAGDAMQEPVTVATDMVEWRNGILDLGALALDGLGEPLDAMVRVGATSFDVRAVSDGVDLGKLMKLLPWKGKKPSGIVAVDLDLRGEGRDTSGCVRLDVSDADVGSLIGEGLDPPKVDLSLGANLVQGRAEVAANAVVGGKGNLADKDDGDSGLDGSSESRVPQREMTGKAVAGGLCKPRQVTDNDAMMQVRLSASLTLPGSVLEPQTWKNITGTSRLQELTADLQKVSQWVRHVVQRRAETSPVKVSQQAANSPVTEVAGEPSVVKAQAAAEPTANPANTPVEATPQDPTATPAKALRVGSVSPSTESNHWLNWDGRLRMQGEFVRVRPDVAPSWSVSVSTSKLSVGTLSVAAKEVATSALVISGNVSGNAYGDAAARAKGTSPGRAPALARPVGSVNDVDVVATASMDSQGSFRLSACLNEQTGLLSQGACVAGTPGVIAHVQASASMDYSKLIEDPSQAWDILSAAELEALLRVDERPIAPLLKAFGLDGQVPVEADRVAAGVQLRGTLRQPQVNYQLRLGRVGATDQQWRAPLSVCAKGSYDAKTAWLSTQIRKSAQVSDLSLLCADTPPSGVRSLGYVHAKVAFPWDQWVLATPRAAGAAKSDQTRPWQADVRAVVEGFELADIPFAADHGLAGTVNLTASLQGLGVSPKFEVQLGLRNLSTGTSIDYARGNVKVTGGQNGVRGSLALVDVDSQGNTSSSVMVRVNTEQIKWLGGWRPFHDGTKPVEIELEAKKFKVGTITPLVQPVLSYVDGELTGRLKAQWSTVPSESKIKELYFFLDNGAFQLPAIGQEFLHVKGLLQAANPQRVFLEGFEATSLTGSLKARGTVDLNGLTVAGANATVWTPSKQSIRLTVGGVSIGDMSGTIRTAFKPSETKNELQVELDGITLELPKSSMRSVQELDDNPDITITPGLVETEKVASKSIPWVVSLKTPKPIVVQRSDLFVRVVASKNERELVSLLYPDPTTDQARMQGHLILYDGRVDVLGHRFFTEENNARVVFDGLPSNPNLNITARWDAPDGIRVFAEVTGTASAPRVKLRSEPALPASQVLSLILFGNTGQDSAENDGSDRTASSLASDVGGGVAAAGLNLLLQDVTPSVSTRIDTSKGQSPSPTVAVQLSQDISAEATYVPEESSMDKGDRYLITVDWRFLRYWSMRITRGNVGTSVFDLLWQYRY